MDDAALRHQIDAATARVSKLDFDLAVARKVLEHLRAMQANPGSRRASGNGSALPSRGDIVAGSLTDHIASLLRKRAKPMRATDIAKGLRADGVVCKAKSGLLAMACSTLRRRDDLFRRVRRGTYTLANSESASKGGP